jgi:hypothetical protein
MSLCLSVYLSLCLSVSLSLCLSVSLSLCLSVSLPIGFFVSPSLCPSFLCLCHFVSFPLNLLLFFCCLSLYVCFSVSFSYSFSLSAFRLFIYVICLSLFSVTMFVFLSSSFSPFFSGFVYKSSTFTHLILKTVRNFFDH